MKPETIINGFRKTGVYPLNKDAIISPSLSTSSAENSLTESMFTSAELVRFEERYSNGYDIFVDNDYVKWLSLHHPEALPDDLGDDVVPPPEDNTSSPNGSVTVDPSNTSPNPDGESRMDQSDSGSDLDKESFTEEQITTFQERYKNGYDLFLDKDYIRWLTLYHPDALPQRADFTSFSEDLEDGSTQARDNEDIHGNSPSDNAGDHLPEISSSTPICKLPPHSTTDISSIQQAGTPDKLQPSATISKSLENTRKVFSAISDFLQFPGGTVSSKKTSKNHCGAKVLTSEQSLALLEDKAKKKREEEEAKERRKQEWEEKKAKREEEKKQKAEERAKKAEERAKKAEERARKAEERKRIAEWKKKTWERTQDPIKTEWKEESVNKIIRFNQTAECRGKQ